MPDLRTAYGAAIPLTITLGGLASSTTLLGGRESDAIDNGLAANQYIDFQVGAVVAVGTNPTSGKRIELWAYAAFDDTPTYPDVFDGADSAESVTSDAIKFACLKFLGDVVIDATSGRAYPIGPASLAAAFGGTVPRRWGVFVTHETGVALAATGHGVWALPMRLTAA